MVRNLEPGDSGSFPADFTAVDSWAYFNARADGLGAELYRTNGNVVQFVAEINPGSPGSYPNYFYGYDGEVYFQAEDAGHGAELWKTDGTAMGTELVCDCAPGDVDSRPSQFTTAGGVLFFQVWANGGTELWRTEGTTGTTELVEINPDGPSDATGLIGDATYLYFGADDGTEVGHEPRRMDVATGTITLMTDLNPENGSNCEDLVAYGDDLIAIADHYWFGRDLWHYDLASPENSIELDDTGWRESQAPIGAEFVVDGDIVYFTGWQAETGLEVGVYDGTDLYQVDVVPGTDGCEPTELTVADGKAFFVGLTETGGNYGLYRLTAPPNPTANLVYEFDTIPPRDLTPFKASVIFVAEDPANGEELWRSTGQNVTRMLLDVNPGPDGSDPQSLTAVGDEIFFTASEPGTGRELWVTDGSAGGTHLVEDLRPGSTGSNPDQLADGYPYLYCSAHTPATGTEIVRATSAGMDLLEVVPGPGSGNPLELAYCGSRLRFSADDGSGVGREPWFLLGSNPTLVYDLNPGPGSSDPMDFGDHLGAIYFTANNGTSGRELWRASGGGVLTMVSESIAPGGPSAQVGDRVSVGNRLYFVAENATYGREIWSTEDNGGPAGAPSTPLPIGAESPQLQAGPNPFGDRMQIQIQMAHAGKVRADLVDASGRVVEQADFGRMEAGANRVDWLVQDGRTLASGVYFLRVQAGETSAVRKVLHVR
jgi:ELWxxDGT repeat protein